MSANNSSPNFDNVPMITDSAIRSAAASESVSEISVYRELLGLEVRGLAGQRARRAAEKLRNGSR